MPRYNVISNVLLRPDPDLASQPVAEIPAGAAAMLLSKLGAWSKITSVDKAGNSATGWAPSDVLVEIRGKEFRLYTEPLSETFEVVVGEAVETAAVANWKKLRVTKSDGSVVTGWINMGESPTGDAPREEPAKEPEPAGPELVLGVNERYRGALLKAQKALKMDAAALAALVDAEADKIREGADKGVWNPKSLNPDSKAGGLTQFLPSTWLGHAKIAGTALNKAAKAKGWVDASNSIAPGAEDDLLALRFDPEFSILSAAEYGVINKPGNPPALPG